MPKTTNKICISTSLKGNEKWYSEKETTRMIRVAISRRNAEILKSIDKLEDKDGYYTTGYVVVKDFKKELGLR